MAKKKVVEQENPTQAPDVIEDDGPLGCPLASCPYEDCDTPAHYPAGPEREAVERENARRGIPTDEELDVHVLGACRACFRWLVHVDIGGPHTDQHAAGCALANDPECFPRTPEEVAMVREARSKGGIAPPAKMPPDPRERIAAERRAAASRQGKGRAEPGPATMALPVGEAGTPGQVAPKPPRKPRKPKDEAPPPPAVETAPEEHGAADAKETPALATDDPETAAPPALTLTATSFLAALERAFPGITANASVVEGEIIDGCNVVKTAREKVDLSVECSPVLYTAAAFAPVEVTPLEGGMYRVYHDDISRDVDAETLKVMRARYLLRRGELTRALAHLDAETQALVVKVFFRGVRPWTPPVGSPLDRMTGPITIAREPGKPVDIEALHRALTTPGGEVPALCPVVDPSAPKLPAAPPKPAFEVPKAHRLPGEHGRECCFWKINVPERTDMNNLPAWLKLCDAHWEKIRLAIESAAPVLPAKPNYVV